MNSTETFTPSTVLRDGDTLIDERFASSNPEPWHFVGYDEKGRVMIVAQDAYTKGNTGRAAAAVTRYKATSPILKGRTVVRKAA